MLKQIKALTQLSTKIEAVSMEAKIATQITNQYSFPTQLLQYWSILRILVMFALLFFRKGHKGYEALSEILLWGDGLLSNYNTALQNHLGSYNDKNRPDLKELVLEEHDFSKEGIVQLKTNNKEEDDKA